MSEAGKGPMEVSVDAEGRIVYTFSGALTKDRLEPLKEAIAQANTTILREFKGSGKKVRILIDGTGYTGGYDISDMEALAELAAANEKHVEKTAGYGGSLDMRAAGDVVGALAGRKNIRFFATKDDALKWLDT